MVAYFLAVSAPRHARTQADAAARRGKSEAAADVL
jgi:hypothetical protein